MMSSEPPLPSPPPPPPPSRHRQGHRASGYVPIIEYGSPAARLGAWIADGVVALLFQIPAMMVRANGPKRDAICVADRIETPCRVATNATLLAALLLWLFGIGVFLTLYSMKVATTGQSWGHRFLALRVVDAKTGDVIGLGRAWARNFAKIVSLWTVLGSFWALWDPRKQTFHDKIVRTVVVKAT
jgi:uncharacterized RDD family membrane protein YckC